MAACYSVTIFDTKQPGATAVTIGGTAATGVMVVNAATARRRHQPALRDDGTHHGRDDSGPEQIVATAVTFSS